MGGATVVVTGLEGTEHTRRLRHQVRMARQIRKGPIGSDPARLSSGVTHIRRAVTKNRFSIKSCPKKVRGIRLCTSPWETKPLGCMFDNFKITKLLRDFGYFVSILKDSGESFSYMRVLI